jgi:NAD(P)-dependent dehydrogenase (short-subunit alcohol dehydrogenase family)
LEELAAMGRFDGKVALISGAASGMGRACSQLFAADGASVFGIDVNEAGLAETAQLVTSAGGKIETARIDLSTRDACVDAVAQAVSTFGKLDILLNVAGIAQIERMTEITEQDWDRMVAINQKAVFFLSQAAIPQLLENAGNIVNVASNAGLMGQAYTVPYCATKGAVVLMTKAMAMEYLRSPLRVNAVCPSGTKTGITANVTMPSDPDPKLMMRYAGMRGMSEPEEIAEAIAFLASDAASSVHGSIFTVDNGVTAG